MPANPASSLAPRDVAERYGVGVPTVLGWIRAGELRAVNVSRSARSKKPRWRITPASLEAFELSRMPTPPAQRAKRRATGGYVPTFY